MKLVENVPLCPVLCYDGDIILSNSLSIEPDTVECVLSGFAIFHGRNSGDPLVGDRILLIEISQRSVGLQPGQFQY